MRDVKQQNAIGPVNRLMAAFESQGKAKTTDVLKKRRRDLLGCGDALDEALQELLAKFRKDTSWDDIDRAILDKFQEYS